MSTLTVSNIKKTGETASRDVSGVAAAWVDIEDGANNILDSVNVSSIDDVGLGDGAVHFTNNIASTSYAITSGHNDNSATTIVYAISISDGTRTASSFDFESAFVNATNNRTNDDVRINFTIHGDLA